MKSVEVELADIASSISKTFSACMKDIPYHRIYASTFKRLTIEASVLIDLQLGLGNSFSQHLWPAMHLNESGYLGRDVISVAAEALQVINGAINHIKRDVGPHHKNTLAAKPTYVDADTIASLLALSDNRFDYARLVQMCRELNIAHQQGCNISVVMLVRSIMDHVPPIFDKKTFSDVVNSRPKSLKETLAPLDSIRKIADTFIHQQIRKRETIPTPTAVNVSNAVETLLQEVVRSSREHLASTTAPA
jgi:hypothetical protein